MVWQVLDNISAERAHHQKCIKKDEHDGLMLPEKIAETYFHVAQQHRSVWTHELDLRPWMETF